jgi:Cys-tRNA(Pro)/Cys-tRNA(Cys) deacylase
MARKNAFPGTPATAALAAAGVPFVLHPYNHDPSAGSYGAEAAVALGIDPARVFKTLTVDVEGRLAVGIELAPADLIRLTDAVAAPISSVKAANSRP